MILLAFGVIASIVLFAFLIALGAWLGLRHKKE
jgi:hypothetical protein